jgi:hypothetical protein
LLRSGEHGSETWECTKEEQRSVIGFLWAEGVPGGQIHQRMCAQYGDNALSRRVVYERIKMFKNGRRSVTDAECSGHPATTAQNEERAKEMSLQNRRVTVDEIAKQLNLRIGSAYSVVHDNLQFHRVCARWVSTELTDEHKHMRLDIFYRHLVRYREGDNFLQRIVTGNVTWVHHYQPETKLKSMQWKHQPSPAQAS